MAEKLREVMFGGINRLKTIYACLSLMIQDVKSNDHSILVIGREDYPQKQFDSDHIKNGMPFSRRIEVMTDWTGRKN